MENNHLAKKYIKIGLIIIFLTGFIIRLCIVWQPMSVLVEKNIPDDSYYYFLIAHNFSQDGMVSFDNINLTNGFHPLWLVVITPIYKILSPLNDLQVHITLSVACIFELLTFFCIYKIVFIFSQRQHIGLLAVLFYALNPSVIFQTTNGLETALEMLFLSLFLWSFLIWMEKKQQIKWAVIVGMVAGLLFLARSDTIFFIMLFYGFTILSWGLNKYFKQILSSGIMACLTVSPWFVWSYLTFGSFMQISGVAVPYAIYQRFLLSNPGASSGNFIAEGIRQFFNFSFWMRGDPMGVPFIMGGILWLFIIIDLLYGKNHTGFKNYKLIFSLLMISTLCLIIAHAGIRWYPRPWYFTPAALAFAIGFSMIFYNIPVRKLYFGLLNLIVVIYFIASGILFWKIGFYPWQSEMYKGAFWLKENIPNNQQVGSFNAGIYAFYSEKHIMNLDGVVNNSAFEAIKQSNILAYLTQNNIHYLIDYDSAIKNEYAPFMGDGFPEDLVEKHVIGGNPTSALGLLRLYQLSGSP